MAASCPEAAHFVVPGAQLIGELGEDDAAALRSVLVVGLGLEAFTLLAALTAKGVAPGGGGGGEGGKGRQREREQGGGCGMRVEGKRPRGSTAVMRGGRGWRACCLPSEGWRGSGHGMSTSLQGPGHVRHKQRRGSQQLTT